MYAFQLISILPKGCDPRREPSSGSNKIHFHRNNKLNHCLKLGPLNTKHTCSYNSPKQILELCSYLLIAEKRNGNQNILNESWINIKLNICLKKVDLKYCLLMSLPVRKRSVHPGASAHNPHAKLWVRARACHPGTQKEMQANSAANVKEGACQISKAPFTQDRLRPACSAGNLSADPHLAAR